MGTSSSYTAPTTTDWSRFKASVTRFVNGNGGPGEVLGGYVAAQGGAAAAGGQAAPIKQSASRLGSFLSSAAQGFDAALEEHGLADVIGQSFETVVSALVDWIAGPANTQEAVAAREAVAEVLVDIFAEAEDDPTLFDAIARDQISESLIEQALLDIVEKWILKDVWRRGGSQVEQQSLSASELRQKEQELRAFLSEAVKFNFGQYSQINLMEANWSSPEVVRIIDELVVSSLEIFGVQE